MCEREREREARDEIPTEFLSDYSRHQNHLFQLIRLCIHCTCNMYSRIRYAYMHSSSKLTVLLKAVQKLCLVDVVVRIFLPLVQYLSPGPCSVRRRLHLVRTPMGASTGKSPSLLLR